MIVRNLPTIDPSTVQERASALCDALDFSSALREVYERSPDWIRAACRAAYGELPPGSRYDFIYAAAEFIREGDEYDDEYINDGTPTAEDLKLCIETYNLLLAELERQVAATSS